MSSEHKSNAKARTGTTTSELAFADAFEGFLKTHKGARAFPKLDGVYREVPGIQGVADFVGVRAPRWLQLSRRLHQQFHGVARGPAAEIVCNLTRPRSREGLLAHSRYSRRLATLTLFQLVRSGVVRQSANEVCRLSDTFRLPIFSLYFFEIKLSKWRRAVGQSLQAKLYANKTYCVFPAGAERPILQHRTLFDALGIGVFFFDPARWKIVESVRARISGSSRRAYSFDVLLRLAMLEHAQSGVRLKGTKARPKSLQN